MARTAEAALIRGVLADGHPHTVDELVDAVAAIIDDERALRYARKFVHSTLPPLVRSGRARRDGELVQAVVAGDQAAS